MTAPDPLEAAAREFARIPRGPIPRYVLNRSRAAIRAYLLAEAGRPRHTFSVQDSLRGMAHRLHPPAETAGEQEGS